jgi:hypothetical protein
MKSDNIKDDYFVLDQDTPKTDHQLLKSRKSRIKSKKIILYSVFFLVLFMSVYFIKTIFSSVNSLLSQGQVLGVATQNNSQFAIDLISYSGDGIVGQAVFNRQENTLQLLVQYDNAQPGILPKAILQEGTCIFRGQQIQTLSDFQNGISTSDITNITPKLQNRLPVSIIIYPPDNSSNQPLACGNILNDTPQNNEKI